MSTKATRHTCMVAFVALGAFACAPEAPPRPSAPSVVPRTDTGARDRLFATAFRDPPGSRVDPSSEEPRVPLRDRLVISEPAPTGRSRGRRVTLDVVQAPLVEVIRLLADVGNVNVVVDESVASSRVTVKLRGVPWDEALQAVVASKGLGLQRSERVYVVTPQKSKS